MCVCRSFIQLEGLRPYSAFSISVSLSTFCHCYTTLIYKAFIRAMRVVYIMIGRVYNSYLFVQMVFFPLFCRSHLMRICVGGDGVCSLSKFAILFLCYQNILFFSCLRLMLVCIWTSKPIVALMLLLLVFFSRFKIQNDTVIIICGILFGVECEIQIIHRSM